MEEPETMGLGGLEGCIHTEEPESPEGCDLGIVEGGSLEDSCLWGWRLKN